MTDETQRQAISAAPSTVAPPPCDAVSTHAWVSAPADTAQGFGTGLTAGDPAAAPSDIAVPDYQIRGELGRGGMGLVLQGHDPRFGRDVAVKVLLESHRDRPELTHRFLSEARIHGQLQHPGVVPVYALGEFADRRPYFTMKLVEGRTLAELLRQRSDPAEDRPRFLKIFEQICQTLAYAHARRVIHRDLKPQNVMVGAFGEVQVLDWGLGKVLGDADASQPHDAEPSYQEHESAELPGSAQEFATQHGVGLGTLAYMPPEQARGEREGVDTRSDVFGLGAILCEILTGAPPYADPNAASRYEQAFYARLSDALARLDACGADAELIAIAGRCLAASPEDRPRDAGALADDVTAYLESVEARLRQAELRRAAAEVQAREERKRRKLTLGLAAAVVVVSVLLGGGLLWLQSQRAETERNVHLALGKAAELRRQMESLPLATSQEADAALAVANQAQAAVEQAEGVLDSGIASEALRSQVAEQRQQIEQSLAETQATRDQLLREQKLLADLDAARMTRMLWIETEAHQQPTSRAAVLEPGEVAEPVGGSFNFAGSIEAYRAALADFGLPLNAAQGQPTPAQIRGQKPAVREAILVALDDCAIALVRSEMGQPADWLAVLRISQAADDQEPRKRFRNALAAGDAKQMKLAAEDALRLRLDSSSVVLVADGLQLANEHAAARTLLRQARHRHPADFWLQFHLGALLGEGQRTAAEVEEQLGCYWAALAIRPDSLAAYNNLGGVLTAKRDLTGAIEAFTTAAAINPRDAWVQSNLGSALYFMRDLHGAAAAYRKALEINPHVAVTQANLGYVLHSLQDFDGAIQAFERALAIDPRHALAHSNLGIVLASKGDGPAAVAHFRKAIELNPGYASAHFNLGVLHLGQGEPDLAEPAFLRAIDSNPQFAAAHEYVGLIRAQRGDLDGALPSLESAVKFDEQSTSALVSLGRALLLMGRYGEAQSPLRKALDIAPPEDRARGAAQEFLETCERMLTLEKKLPDVLAGDQQPANLQETLGFTELCRHQRRFAAAVRFFRLAFAEDAQLAEDVDLMARFDAAWCAAAAGSGEGLDAAALTSQERQALRRQALEWLRADLAVWKLRRSGGQADHSQIAVQMRNWQLDNDLAVVRDQSHLTRLPEAEQFAWRGLWSEVASLQTGLEVEAEPISATQ